LEQLESLQDLAGRGLRILLLGSYDEETKIILHRIRVDINNKFQRYSSFTLLLENIDVFIALEPGSHDFSILMENEAEFKGTVSIIRQGVKIIETINFNNKIEYDNTIGENSKTIDFTKFRKLKEFEKLSFLANWADIVFLVKHRELTRGGELVEATYLLLRNDVSFFDPQKLEFFYQKDVITSSMLKELFEIRKIRAFPYENYDSLLALSFQQTEQHIFKLNTIMNRFAEFEGSAGIVG